MVALRLAQYGERLTSSKEVVVDLHTLTQDDLSEREVKTGLKQLAAEDLLDWHDEEVVRLTAAQKKRLERFYMDE